VPLGGVIRGMDCLGEEFGSRDSNEILESVGQYLRRRYPLAQPERVIWHTYELQDSHVR
jgi:hypothetical protein